MKKKLQLGSQIDINASFEGGAVDTSVEYSVPTDSQEVVSVTATGIVSGLALGTGTVEIKTPDGKLLRAITFQVLSAENFAMQEDLDTGAVEFTAAVTEVPQAPTFTLVTGGTAFASSTYEGSPANVYDGQDGTLGYPPATLWGSYDTFASTVNAFIGKNFDSPKMIKKIRVQWVTAPTQVDVIVHSGNVNVTPLTTILPSYQDFNGPNTVQWQEFILPAYAPMTGIILKPKVATAVSGSYWETHGGVIDRFRVWEIEFYE